MKKTMIEQLSAIFPKIRGAYLVGGSIRDHLLGKVPVDYDLVVLENPREYGRRLASKIPGHLVEIGKPGQTIVRVVSRKISVDISLIEGKTIAEDLQRRDFSINAMAYELVPGKFIDEVGGQQDLSRKVVRMLSPRAFVNDPVRLLRAFRLAAGLEFTIEIETLAAIAQHVELIKKSAGERIKDELFKMLQSDSSHPFLLQMVDSGLFRQLFPEFFEAKKEPAKPNHNRPALEDTFAAYGQLEDLLKDPAQHLPPALEPHYRELKDSAKALLKFSTLWHNIGGPVIDQKNTGLHIDVNATRSAEMAQRLCRRYRFANRHSQYIHFIIKNQSRPFWLFSADQNRTLTRDDTIRFFMKSREQTPGLLLHALAKMYAQEGKNSPLGRAFLGFVIHLLQDGYSGFKAKAALRPLITGRDLMAEFELEPSPLFKEILHVIEEARLSGRAKTRSDALQMVKKILAGHARTE
jgi:tRNA nucleotidyltransferase/poly(A) polymerase